jgi:hypothetical protein
MILYDMLLVVCSRKDSGTGDRIIVTYIIVIMCVCVASKKATYVVGV